ncbi:MAG: peptidoglycan editing factor PgeF [Lachnospiraceae bacterium]|nr:peptidoglycan editing factor PgeF [Lachnospiraceae bacterium]
MGHLLRKQSSDHVRENWNKGVLYFTFPPFEQIPFLCHGFSSRLGGVSENELGEMNLSYTRGDIPERVDENFRRIADAVGFPCDRMVFSDQTHTTNVREVTRKDCGKGTLFERDYQDVDGLVTNEPGVVLTTFYADCVPLYLVDPVHRAIGLSHSGWKGTVYDIACVTVEKMQGTYGTDPASVIAAIGPSICQDCYEVGEDVVSQFREHYPESVWPLLFRPNRNDRFQLNLWEACRINMQNAGIRSENIFVTDLCTCCNPDVLFSHRASHGKRGNLAAFLAIRDW